MVEIIFDEFRLSLSFLIHTTDYTYFLRQTNRDNKKNEDDNNDDDVKQINIFTQTANVLNTLN